MSHPDQLPDLFLDRSLGRVEVPRLLRAAGLRLVTLAEHYGIPQDEEVADVIWLRDAGERGWVVLMKDTRIRRRRAEQQALIENRVRAFCLSAGSLGSAEMARRFLLNLDAMTEACQDPGPFLYAVQATRIVRLRVY
ncbi:MAG: hypothetical protein WAL50_12195 [Kineosporiaceae bacterium]